MKCHISTISEKSNKRHASLVCVSRNEFYIKDKILHEVEVENIPDNFPLSVLQ